MDSPLSAGIMVVVVSLNVRWLIKIYSTFVLGFLNQSFSNGCVENYFTLISNVGDSLSLGNSNAFVLFLSINYLYWLVCFIHSSVSFSQKDRYQRYLGRLELNRKI